MDKKGIQSKNDIEEENIVQGEDNVNSSHRPFLSRLYSKTTPIGFQYHQVFIPPWTGQTFSRDQRRQLLTKRPINLRPQPTFLASKTNSHELQDFLNFAQSYYQEKISDYFTAGTVSRQRTRARAMDFLHKMDYNYIKAKFYILFPYYLTYNTYRCHDPLNISLQDMQKKIKDHLQGLKNTKQKDMQRWIQTLQNCLSNRTSFQKFMSLVDQGKQNKYQMPQSIKQHIQKSQKMGKQLKKSVQGNKLTIQALRSKKQLLDQYKLITPDMVAFQDTVNRCQQWIKKQEAFQQRYVNYEKGQFKLKDPNQKIEFKQMQMLVTQYHNLPLICSSFQSNFKAIYARTLQLLQNIPNINKIVKTRNAKQSNPSKIPYKQIKEYLKIIENHPIWHEQFLNYEVNMRQSIQLIQRLNMYLQDPLSQKNSKTLNNYIKLISDVQIENNVEKRLRNRQECNDIIERIKKQMSHPGKVESIKQSYNKLKQKGNKQSQDLAFQQKILLYLGWYQSQQKLKEPKPVISNLQIIQKELQLKQKLVSTSDYKSQLQSAKRQLNIGEQLIQQANFRLQKNQQHQITIKQLLNDPNPNLQRMIDVLKQCISFGMMFTQLQQLHDQIVRYFVDLAKIHSLLKLRPENLEQEVQRKFFFSPQETDHIISIVVYPEQMKSLKTKQKAEQLLKQIMQSPFPRYLQECKAFEDFMKKGQQWAQRAKQLIKNFTQLGDNIDIKQLEDSRYYIHSKAIKQEIGKIQTIMRWRQKISKKLDDGRPQLFSQEQAFLTQLQRDLDNFELNPQSTSYKQLYLQYSRDHDINIKKVLNLIVLQSKIQNNCKLSEMNKFHRQIEKQIERHNIDDKKILELKQKFRDQIIAADEWKQRYLIIKRFQKKKMLKKEDQQNQVGNEENIMIQQEGAKEYRQANNLQIMNENVQHHHNSFPNRKKYNIKNGQFAWYFKFLIMILQFSKGYKLKFCLQQLCKLKNSLSEIQKFIRHYDKVFEKTEPYDSQLTNLDVEACKIQIFIRQIWLLKKKNAYVHAWRIIADSILQSIPIVNIQLKARKPEQLLTALANKKMETQQANKQNSQQKSIEPNLLKRQRKPNSYYFTSDITLYAEQNPSSKPKKKKKGNNGDGQYRNTAVASQVKKSTRNQLQEIQMQQAIIKASVQAGALTQDPKEYCICRYGQPNENSIMVQCDSRCDQWYHIQCIGMKRHQAKGDNRYTCVGCSTLYGLKSQGAFCWDYRNKISEYALEQIVNQGKNLGVVTQQLKKIVLVYQKMKGWKKSVNQLIGNILRDDFLGKQISVYKDKLYQAYLLSLWLPTFHYQTSTIKKLLFYSRNESIEQVQIQ